MNNVIEIDFETRSCVDLRTSGPWAYAEHPSTEIICMSFKYNDALPKVHIPKKFLSEEVKAHFGAQVKSFDDIAIHIVEDKNIVLEAHNAEFERAIWYWVCCKRWGWPEIPIERWRCSAARAAALGLPRSLDGAGKALNLPIKKDIDGHRLMLKMCKPRGPKKAEKIEWLLKYEPLGVESDAAIFFKTAKSVKPKDTPLECLQFAEEAMPTLWHETPEQVIQLSEYCIQDVEAEHCLSKHISPLSNKEQQLWFLDQHINSRGVGIDVEGVTAAIEIIAKEEEKYLEELKALTHGVVKSVRQIAATREWLATRGVHLENLQKATVETAISEGNIKSESARRVLEIRQSLGKSSTSKFKTMLKSKNKDGRARGLFLYHGASTGRWSGKRIQTQNMARPEYSGLDLCINTIKNGHSGLVKALWGDPIRVLASCARGMLVPAEGHDFICGDFRSIEMVVLNYLAGGELKLAAFRRGEDIYKFAAAEIYSVSQEDITKKQRQIGKVSELALGYQGAVGAFQQMATGYGVEISDELAREIVNLWRKNNPEIVAYWKKNEYAVLRAIRTGDPVRMDNVVWGTHGDFLFCKLPSGRLMAYYKPEIKTIQAPWGPKESITYMGVNSKTYKWERIHTYGGKLVENITQATAREMLAEAMFRVEAARYKIVMHVHDEILAEVPEGFGSKEEFEAIMSVPPSWAEGCPIGAEAWRGKRYRK